MNSAFSKSSIDQEAPSSQATLGRPFEYTSNDSEAMTSVEYHATGSLNLNSVAEEPLSRYLRHDRISCDNIRADATQQSTIYNPCTSNAVFSISPNPQLESIAFDMNEGEATQQMAHYNPFTSDAVFSLLPTSQNYSTSFDSTGGDAREQNTLYNPFTSNAVFSLSPNPQLENIAFDMNEEEATQQMTHHGPSTSDATVGLFPNSQPYRIPYDPNIGKGAQGETFFTSNAAPGLSPVHGLSNCSLGIDGNEGVEDMASYRTTSDASFSRLLAPHSNSVPIHSEPRLDRVQL